MHLHEIMNSPIEDYEAERRRLEKLFWHTPVIAVDDAFILDIPPTTMKGFLADSFRKSRFRRTATDIDDFFGSLSLHWKKPSLEGLFLYCETLMNLIQEFMAEILPNPDAKKLASQINHSIGFILENRGYTTYMRKDGIIEIVQKDDFATIVVENLTDEDAAGAVREYTHYGLKGKLKKKRELLRIIGQYVEPILQDAEMKGTYGWLTKDLGCCLNSLHIRHNNKEGDKANAVVQAMSDGELEECYDNTYREMLLLIELQKNLPFRRKVEGLREQLGGKKGGSAG